MAKKTTVPTITFGDDGDTGFYHDGTDISIAIGGVPMDPPLTERMEKIERNLEKVMKRLSVLDEPTDEQLEKHKMLKEAYTKYKFIIFFDLFLNCLTFFFWFERTTKIKWM